MTIRSLVLLLTLLTLAIEISAQESSSNKPGCSLVATKYQSQFVTFEKTEDAKFANERQPSQRVVLRIRNNTNCDITLLTWDNAPQRLAIVIGDDGKNRITYTNDFPDGSFIANLKYIVRLQEPAPPVNRRRKLIAMDEVLDYFVLKAGRSVLFKVNFDRFDKWITVEVPFYYSWDLDANATRVYHRAYFGNLDLPDDVFTRTKLCHTLPWCK